MMRAFHREIDLKDVNEWLAGHGKGPLLDEDIPKVGAFMDGVACGFLVGTDTSSCFLDLFVSNPKASAGTRNEAISQISKWLINIASAVGYKRILVLSKVDSILERAKDLGFKMSDTRVLSLELGG